MRQLRQPRSESQRARDLLLISQYYKEDWAQQDIAKQLGISQATVSKELKDLESVWTQESLANLTEKKNREISKIDLVELEAWDAWAASRSIKLQIQTEAGETARGAISLEKRRRENTPGDPRFLDLILKCISQRCELLNLKTSMSIVAKITRIEIHKSERPRDVPDVVDSVVLESSEGSVAG